MERILRIDGKPTDLAGLRFQEYRKRPVTVQALQIQAPFEVATLEGTMQGNPGDWLIRGVAGELYPCKPDVFQKTYEPLPLGPDEFYCENCGKRLPDDQYGGTTRDGCDLCRDCWEWWKRDGWK